MVGAEWSTYPLSRYEDSGSEWVDGAVVNSGDQPIENLSVWRNWELDGWTYDDEVGIPLDCWVLRPSEFAVYSAPIESKAANVSVLAHAEVATKTRIDLPIDVLRSGAGVPSGRWWECRVTNNTAQTVDGVLATGYEDQSGAPWTAATGAYLDTLYPGQEYPDQLAPGESCIVELWGGNSTVDPNKGIWGYVRAEALRKAPLSPVYRFFNRRTGTHFYTNSESEKTRVIETLGSTYSYDGIAYHAFDSPGVRTLPMYRFFNRRTGTHFYTNSESEKNAVIFSLARFYTYEGIAFYVAGYASSATDTVYRFYNRRTGTHFYTASESEKARVISSLGAVYNYEGEGFRVPK